MTLAFSARPLRTVTKADARRRWVRLERLRPGAHRVVARVQFARAAQTRDRTLPRHRDQVRAVGAVTPLLTG